MDEVIYGPFLAQPIACDDLFIDVDDVKSVKFNINLNVEFCIIVFVRIEYALNRNVYMNRDTRI
jgi:hypothetical protein